MDNSQILAIVGWIFGGGFVAFFIGFLTIKFVIKEKRETANQSVIKTDTSHLQLNDNLRASLDSTINQLAKYAETIAKQSGENLETEKQLKICLDEKTNLEKQIKPKKPKV